MGTLGNFRIWKISEGTNNTSDLSLETKQKLLEENAVAIYGETKAKGISKTTQGELFQKHIKDGDFFYLCYGKNIVLLGQFTGDVLLDNPDLDEGWVKRKYELVCKLDTPVSFTNNPEGKGRWWYPTDFSTCIEVPKEQINEFKEKILSLFPYNRLTQIIDNMTEYKGKTIKNPDPKATIPPATNTLLFGPPGTGKTYSVVLKAMSIIDGKPYSESISSNEYSALKKRFDEYQNAGQIAFVTFHQSYSYEDFIEGIKPVSPDTETGNIVYKVQDGILKKIADRATENYLSYSEGDVPSEYNFEKLKKAIIEKYENDEGIVLKLVGGKEIPVKINEHQTFMYGKSKETTFHVTFKNLEQIWKRRSTINSRKDVNIYNSSYHYAALKYLEDIAKTIKPLERQELKQYVLIIDEINRGNISKIFGEMITLIEPSKRIGCTEATQVILPYSSSENDSDFVVTLSLPPNLHIVGTMNTADRSIMLLDTALRRRFKFKEMMPNPELLSGLEEKCSVDLKKLLTTLNERIESIYDRDHTIGHAYLMHINSFEDLQAAFAETVIPLLQEYFYGNWEKIIWVLNDEKQGFITKKPLPMFDESSKQKYRYEVNPNPELSAFEQLAK